MSQANLEIRRISGHAGPVPGVGLKREYEVAKLIDTTTCIGCKACEVACLEWNGYPFHETTFDNTYQTMPDTQWNYYNLIRFNEHQFADGTFDSCRADRVLQHLENPQKALSELVRVARAGARVAISDPDWDTIVIDAADRELTRQIVAFRCDTLRNGWMGRQHTALASQCGLVDVTTHAFTTMSIDWPLANRMLDLEASAHQAAAGGVISPSDVAEWLRDLVERHEAGCFLCAITGFTVCGRKP